MAQRISSGRGATATRTTRQVGNRTPNTPGISESEISRMRVDDIRGQLRRRGVSGISALRKPELVKTLARTLRAEGRAGGAARRSTGPSGRAPARKPAARRSAAPAAGARKSTSARTKAAPAPARKATAARKAAPAAARRAATSASRAKVTSASRAKATSASRAKATSPSRSAATASSRAKPAIGSRTGPKVAGSGTRTGRSTSRSVRSSQLISSPADRPERPGRSLVTTNHQVIRNWAAARGAKPATIAGTERGGRPGVLTFDLPGYRVSRRLQAVSWDDWFRTFDSRKLNLIFQEQLRDGRQSNFFRTESPDREAG
ncbi:hypothetical protein ACIG87_17015 [Micromonospora sp. NPDC051925]|uniref:hypothetical protein n=1 Tax=Micromonospora sp. NPDC051925 TaxID=3364288 RepID=UPI0037C72687